MATPIVPIYKDAQSYWIVLIIAFYALVTYMIIKYNHPIKYKSVKELKSHMAMPAITVLTWVIALICIFSIYALAI